jgi:hypothetical protein
LSVRTSNCCTSAVRLNLSTDCQSAVCLALLPASHVTAGGLVRENAGNASVTVGAGNKAVPNVDANQLLLLRGLELYRPRVDDEPILRDPHFSLLDANGEVVACRSGDEDSYLDC